MQLTALRAAGGPGGVSWTQRMMGHTETSDAGRLFGGSETPRGDGWAWLYDLFHKLAPHSSYRRALICSYFRPGRLEMAANSRLYRWSGVAAFGRFIPTGGIGIRRLTGAKMRPYTLHRASLAGAREFYYRACVFESLHMPFFLALVLLAVQRYTIGRADYALENSVVNLFFNLFPMLHHRHTRARIVRLLSRRMSASRGVTAG